jgi:hypothetical protein
MAGIGVATRWRASSPPSAAVGRERRCSGMTNDPLERGARSFGSGAVVPSGCVVKCCGDKNGLPARGRGGTEPGATGGTVAEVARFWRGGTR